MMDDFRFQHSHRLQGVHYELWDHLQLGQLVMLQKRLEAEVVQHRNPWDMNGYAPFTKYHTVSECCFWKQNLVLWSL